MKLEEGQIITLEDNRDYIIMKKTFYNNDFYLYLMAATKPIEVSFVKQENGNDVIILNPISDKKELEMVMNLFE